MTGIELLLHTAQSMSEDELILGLERVSRALQQTQHPTARDIIKKSLLALCMLYVSKERLTIDKIEDILRESKQVQSLHKLFAGKSN
jgi:hypothetical protein